MPLFRLLILLATLVASPAHADRAALSAALCAPALGEQIAALAALAEAGAAGGADEARWAGAVVAAVEARSLRCAPGGAFIGEGEGARDAATLAAAPAPEGATALPVNNRLRAAAAS
ncbi:MAG TPA: hypothetical protein VLA78_14160, partial [Paracoccaceae bacterium]|nr:hypothetical protein [Paracoccaceae bacterium]